MPTLKQGFFPLLVFLLDRPTACCDCVCGERGGGIHIAVTEADKRTLQCMMMNVCMHALLACYLVCACRYLHTLFAPDIRTCRPWLLVKYHSDGLGRPEKWEAFLCVLVPQQCVNMWHGHSVNTLHCRSSTIIRLWYCSEQFVKFWWTYTLGIIVMWLSKALLN